MTVDTAHFCGVCRSFMDEEDLFCSVCGTENPVAAKQTKALVNVPSPYSFDCQSCGASMSFDASAQALRCPFCGSTQMERREGARSIRPDRLIEFQVSRDAAEDILRKWLGRGFWRPGDAARSARIGKMAAVYVPYWVFRAQTDTIWTADSSPAPPGSYGNWYPVTGHHHSDYSTILVGGSSVLTPYETDSIAPFDMRAAVEPERVSLDNWIVEVFKVPRKLARPLARSTIESYDLAACQRKVPGRARNVHVNVRIGAMQGAPMLLPVWILAYRYKKNVRRVLINGQTGRIAGSAPFSYTKLAMVVLGAVMLAGIVFWLILLANR